jgi:hypothetical protein
VSRGAAKTLVDVDSNMKQVAIEQKCRAMFDLLYDAMNTTGLCIMLT